MKGAVIQAGQEGRCRRPGKGQEGVKQPPEGWLLGYADEEALAAPSPTSVWKLEPS